MLAIAVQLPYSHESTESWISTERISLPMSFSAASQPY